MTRGEDLLRSEPPDVAALRGHFQLSQAKFAALLLLRVAAAHPEALLSVTQQPAKRRAS